MKTCMVSLVLEPDELERLDDWRLKNRMWSRSGAIRQMVADSLSRLEQPEAVTAD
jgi:hypothetical protein